LFGKKNGIYYLRQREEVVRLSAAFKYFSYWFLIALLFLTFAEISSRLDDWLRWGFSPFAQLPDRDEELFFFDGIIRRGRPNGKFKQFQLNEFGFRAPKMTEFPGPGSKRIMILGASESFGMYESVGKEFPTQLAVLLKSANPAYEVVNAALFGLSCGTMKPYWVNWASRFRPSLVLIYPSTHLYLNEFKADLKQPGVSTSSGFEWRFKIRLRESMPVVRNWWKWLRQSKDPQAAHNPPDWIYESAPIDRLDALMQDLSEVVQEVAAQGAKPVLLTHAISATVPPRPEDADHLESMHPYTPRATSEVLVKFEQEANRRILMLGREKGIPVVDIAGSINGRREFFADLVHFNDAGASTVANLLAEWIKNNE